MSSEYWSNISWFHRFCICYVKCKCVIATIRTERHCTHPEPAEILHFGPLVNLFTFLTACFLDGLLCIRRFCRAPVLSDYTLFSVLLNRWHHPAYVKPKPQQTQRCCPAFTASFSSPKAFFQCFYMIISGSNDQRPPVLPADQFKWLYGWFLAKESKCIHICHSMSICCTHRLIFLLSL